MNLDQAAVLKVVEALAAAMSPIRPQCYQFYKILKAIYPSAAAWYDHNHILTEIGGHWYDVDGLVPIESGEQANYYLLDSYGPSHVRSLEAGQPSHFKDQLGIYFIAVPINRSDSTTKPYLP